MKKFFVIIVSIFFFLSLLHLQIIGWGAKLYLKTWAGYDFVYKRVDWKEGGIVFSDVVIYDPSFHAHVEKISLYCSWDELKKKVQAHVSFEKPNISFLEVPTAPVGAKSQWYDLSYEMHEGVIHWDGAIDFSLSHRMNQTDLELHWKEGSAHLSQDAEKQEIVLDQFPLSILQPWSGFCALEEGSVTGRVSFDSNGDLKMAHLTGKELGGRIGAAAIEHLQASAIYSEDVGFKWDCLGVGKSDSGDFPFSWEGKGGVVPNKEGGLKNLKWLDSRLKIQDRECEMAASEALQIRFEKFQKTELLWLQEVARVFFPEMKEWEWDCEELSAEALLQKGSWNVRFLANELAIKTKQGRFPFTELKGYIGDQGGRFALLHPDYQLEFDGLWKGWTAKASLFGAALPLRGKWNQDRLEIQIQEGCFSDLTFSGSGWIDPQLDLCFSLTGEWNFLGRKIPLCCPILTKSDSIWHFDVRSPRKFWDLFRMSANYDGNALSYEPVSHFLGSKIEFLQTHPSDLICKLELHEESWKAFFPLLNEWGIKTSELQFLKDTDLTFQWKNGKIDLFAKAIDPHFSLHLFQLSENWHIDLISDYAFQAELKPDGTIQGEAGWKQEAKTKFHGKMDSSLNCKCFLTDAFYHLNTQEIPVQAKLKGEGHFIYQNGQIEADLDFDASSVEIETHLLENKGSLHLYYTSDKGALLQGIHLHGEFDCVIDLLEYSEEKKRWIFHGAQAHIPGSFLTHRFFNRIDREKALNFTADLEFTQDFSSFTCSMKEGVIPYDGTYYPIEDLHLTHFQNKCRADLLCLGHFFSINFEINEELTGKISIGKESLPLTIAWRYGSDFFIDSIEGNFNGIESASFHAEAPNQLVGSAHLHFTKLSWLPSDIIDVFEEIQMGGGYEMKGRLKLEKSHPSFQGILTGKGCELFGFQFRTLFASVELTEEKVSIRNVKMSDSAGVMKIDEIRIEGTKQTPWTISIPNLTILQMRPSLLLRPGGSLGPMTPLVVRELKMHDFEGLLDDGKTYRAKGNLHFINSYKREETVFDLPANVLSRIVGLDLELLVPVVGDIDFELKDGAFYLLDLTDAYSEGKRSQFFLEMDPPPKMDLDGNIEIYIKMKQFVLLKITESFLISIDGKLEDPQFRLKKRRFFGLI